MMTDVETVMYDIIERLTKHREEQLRTAIEETDWDECGVLDMVRRPIDFASDEYVGKFEVYRYANTAPRQDCYGDEYEIRRVTKPLLDRLAVQHPEVDLGV